jgi:CRP-like cAMP-binding protein
VIDSKEEYALLAKTPIFSQLSDRSVRKLVRLCVPRSYDTGETIIAEGDTGLGLFVITKGSADVLKGRGVDQIKLATLGRGDIVGELALIDEQPRSASVIAVQPTECLLITRSGFHELVQHEPDIAWCFVPVLSERLRALQELAQSSVNSAVAQEGNGLFDEETERLRDDDSSTTQTLVSLPHAFARAGVTGLSVSVDLCRSFLDAVAEETGIDDGNEATSVARKLPGGFFKGIEAAIGEFERMPERMLKTFRHHLRRS